MFNKKGTLEVGLGIVVLYAVGLITAAAVNGNLVLPGEKMGEVNPVLEEALKSPLQKRLEK